VNEAPDSSLQGSPNRVGRSRPFSGRSLLLAEGRHLPYTRRSQYPAAVGSVGGRPTFGFPDGTPIDTHGIDEPMLTCFCFFGPTGVATM
jgi:hypothetical protein